jgi:hypothetical protein
MQWKSGFSEPGDKDTQSFSFRSESQGLIEKGHKSQQDTFMRETS